MGWRAIVPPRTDTTDYAGFCHRYARNFFGAPMGYSSAWEAWEATQFKNGPEVPIPNVPVILWYSHYGTYQGIYKNWGHVTPIIPGDAIYTSPGYGGPSFERWQTISQIESRFNSKYVGWSPDINGLLVAEWVPDPDPIQEDDMPRILNMRSTTNHVDPNATQKTIYFDGPAGIKGIQNQEHLRLLQRYIADRSGDQMYAHEFAIVNSYLTSNVPTLTADTVEAAATRAIKSAGGSVEASQIAAAVEATLKDDFAAIPSSVAKNLSDKLSS